MDTIYGYVTDNETGEGVEGVAVQFRKLSCGSYVYHRSRVTDADGYYAQGKLMLNKTFGVRVFNTDDCTFTPNAYNNITTPIPLLDHPSIDFVSSCE